MRRFLCILYFREENLNKWNLSRDLFHLSNKICNKYFILDTLYISLDVICIKIRRISLLVTFYDTQGPRWTYSIPQSTGEIAFNNFSRVRFARNFKFIKPRGHASNERMVFSVDQFLGERLDKPSSPYQRMQ